MKSKIPCRWSARKWSRSGERTRPGCGFQRPRWKHEQGNVFDGGVEHGTRGACAPQTNRACQFPAKGLFPNSLTMPKIIQRCPECKTKYPSQMAKMTVYFNLCPVCGELFRKSKRTIISYLHLICAHEEEILEPTLKLARKGELTAAAREALIALEDCVKRVSKLKHLRGKNLMTEAFSFDWDSATKKITKRPVIAVNKLRTESQRNEQSGIQHISIGLMVGPRNILAHNSGGITIGSSLSIISAVAFVLHHISSDGSRVSDIR